MKKTFITNKIQKKYQTGLTIIELVMTLAIVAILASVAVPSFSNMNASQKLSGVAQKIQQDLLFARSESIKQNANIYLSISAGTNWCYGFTDSGSTCSCGSAGSCQINSSNKTVSSSDFGNITLSTAGSLSLNGANFNSSRGAVEKSGAALNNGTITISNDNDSAKISINALGRSSICSNTLTSYSSC